MPKEIRFPTQDSTCKLIEKKHGMALYRIDNGNVVVRRWWNWGNMLMLALGILFTSAGIASLGTDYNPTYTRQAPNWIILPIGLGVFYFGLVGVVNRTRVIMTSKSLIIHRGPLPGLHRKSRTLEPLRTVKLTIDNTHTLNGRFYKTYVVEGTLTNSKIITIDLLKNKQHAEYMVRLLKQ